MGFMHMKWEHHILETLTFDSMKSEKNKKSKFQDPIILSIVKGKVIPLQAQWRPEGG
jgi:hypothetical protein